MRTFTAAVLRHRLLVSIVWILVSVAGGVLVPSAVNGLTSGQPTPGLPGYDANQAMIHELGIDGNEAPVIAVLKLPQGQTMNDEAGRTIADRVFGAGARAGHVGVIDYRTSGDSRFVSRDGTTTWAMFNMPNPDSGPYTATSGELAKALDGALPAKAQLTITGDEALQSTVASTGSGPSTLTETLIGALAALLVLAFVFGSAVAAAPLLMALPTILTTFLLLRGLEQLTSVSSLQQYLLAFIGLGVAIDYSLLIVTRWREERDRGVDNDAAILVANDHAGRAVLLSGLTVGIGMLALLVIPVQFLRGIGLASLLIPLVAMAAAVTLLPVLLSAWGPALDRRRVHRWSTTYSRGWERWARLVVRRRWAAVAVGALIMVALALPALGMNTGQPSPASLGGTTPAATAFHELQDQGVPQAVALPIQVLVAGDSSAVERVVKRARATPGVWAAYPSELPSRTAEGYGLVTVIPDHAGYSSAGAQTVSDLRAALAHGTEAVKVGGTTAANIDFTDAIYAHFPLLLLVISFATFLLLARAFRSAALALKAVVLNLVSLGATFGFMVLFWQDGLGSHALYGVGATHAIRNWAPILVFAFLFGVSMDYEVFVLSRMREEYDERGGTNDAIVRSIARTGRLVTCAAVILGISFVSLSTTNDIAVQVPATGLAVGVVLDAIVVRTLLVPAVAALLGSRNWWLPKGLAWLLRTRPSSPSAQPELVLED